jgi:hypothetical protein
VREFALAFREAFPELGFGATAGLGLTPRAGG